MCFNCHEGTSNGTLFHIEEGSEEEGSEWAYFDEEPRERGQDNRVMPLETFRLITTGHEMPFLIDNRLSCSLAVEGENLTKIDLVCGQPHLAT